MGARCKWGESEDGWMDGLVGWDLGFVFIGCVCCNNETL
jgi:hypothetical protein